MKTLFVLLLVFAADDSPRKQSAIAPSLKALSKDEEAKIEEVIDRFVKADTGRLKGDEARKAAKEFDKLPPEAIPALIRALNKASKEEQTCPVLMITKKLKKMLLASDDDKLLEFAKDEIGADGADRSRYGPTLRSLRFEVQLRRNALARAPKPKPPEPKGLSKQSTADLAKLASTERGDKLAAVVAELGKRDGKEALDGLTVATSVSDARLKRLAREALEAHLGRLGATALAERLEDDSAEVRRAAIRPAAKQAKLVPKVIDRTDDDSPEVRAEARAALKALSKGEDYGPAPGASAQQRREAKKKWQAWWQGRK
jgi:hypothetical protein